MSVKVHEPVCFDSFQDLLIFFDDFHGDQLQDEWQGFGTGSATVVDQQTGGIVRITTGALANDSYRIDWSNIRSLHVDQRVSLEFRVKLTQTTNVIVVLALLFDWDNRIYFEYDSGMSANWYIKTRDGGAATPQDSGIAADTSYHIFRIECHTHGSNHVHFYIDGTETANSPINTNIPDDATDYLQPRLWIQTTVDAIKSMDVDYCYLRQDR